MFTQQKFFRRNIVEKKKFRRADDAFFWEAWT
jgi:hypothetical protein